MQVAESAPNPRAKRAVWAFLLGVVLVITFGLFPQLRPQFTIGDQTHTLSMPETIEIVMMACAALILLVGKANVEHAVKGNVFGAGMNAKGAGCAPHKTRKDKIYGRKIHHQEPRSALRR